MGDKSPKSKAKNQNQKQGKADAVAAEKKRVIDSKQVAAVTPKKK